MAAVLPVFVLVETAVHAQFIPVGATAIEGVQDGYSHPVLLPAVLSFALRGIQRYGWNVRRKGNTGPAGRTSVWLLDGDRAVGVVECLLSAAGRVRRLPLIGRNRKTDSGTGLRALRQWLCYRPILMAGRHGAASALSGARIIQGAVPPIRRSKKVPLMGILAAATKVRKESSMLGGGKLR